MPDDDDDDVIDEKFVKSFNKLFHKASAEREKRFKNSIVKDIGELMTSKLDEAMGEKLGAIIDSKLIEFVKDDPEDEGDGKKPDGVAKLSPEHEALIRQSQKDAQEAKALAEKYKKDADAEKEKSRRTEEKGLLTQALTGKVKPTVLGMVVNQLHAGNVVRDPESDKVLWKNEDGELLPFQEGLEAWTKSDVGKEFAPARAVGGTGGRSPDGMMGGKGGKPGDLSPESLSDIIAGSIPR